MEDITEFNMGSWQKIEKKDWLDDHLKGPLKEDKDFNKTVD